jgi:hypothetical protein
MIKRYAVTVTWEDFVWSFEIVKCNLPERETEATLQEVAYFLGVSESDLKDTLIQKYKPLVNAHRYVMGEISLEEYTNPHLFPSC